MNTLSALEFDLMDELYFITPFRGLPQAIGQSESVTIDTLRSLLQKEYTWQFYFDGKTNLCGPIPSTLIILNNTTISLLKKGCWPTTPDR